MYGDLSRHQKTALAERVADAQARVARLPEGRGFGYAAHSDGPFSHATWTDVIRASLGRSRGRVAAVRAPAIAALPRLERAALRLAPVLDAIRPTPFLDDTTTKNVIVDRGALSGIVDVDWLCYGDPLFPIALTRAALLSEELDTDYVDAWFRCAARGPGRGPASAPLHRGLLRGLPERVGAGLQPRPAARDRAGPRAAARGDPRRPARRPLGARPETHSRAHAHRTG